MVLVEGLVLPILGIKYAFSDTLSDVMNSRAYHGDTKSARHSQKKGALNTRWLPPGENFTKLFRDSEGMFLLLDWVGARGVAMLGEPPKAYRTPEYVAAEKKFVSDKVHRIDMRILVPHPKYATTAEIDLIPEFAQLRPPGLKIVYSEEQMIKDTLAVIYEKEDGGCSLVLPIVRQGLISFSVDHCTQKQSMIDLANQLDYSRLNSKLES